MTLKLLKKIGDQDRGHNFLVEMTDEFLISELYNHCVFMKNIPHGLGEIFKKSKKEVSNSGTILYFFPWARVKIYYQLFEVG